jgi:uncharacterized membrane protein YedE/YeeE
MDSLLTRTFDFFNIANLLLAALLVVFIWIGAQAAKKNNFDWSEMLKGGDGKPSALRLGILVSIAVSSWVLVYAVLNKAMVSADLVYLFGIYLAVWSGAKVAEKFIEGWVAVRTGNNSSLPPTT